VPLAGGGHIPSPAAGACGARLRRLAADLRGCWQERNADLLAEDEHEFGYRLVVADLEEVA
jgi:hypothetical protein